MDNVSITVPMTLAGLNRAEDFFHGLAVDLAKQTIVVTAGGDIQAGDLIKVDPSSLAGAAKIDLPRTDKLDPASYDKQGTGIPWDARIHTKSKLRLAKDDSWKLIKSIETKSPGLVASVTAELLVNKEAALSVELGIAPAPIAPAPIAPAPIAPAPIAPAPIAPAPIAPAPIAPAPIAPAPIDFAGLTLKITPRVQADPNYMQIVGQVLAEFKIEGGLPAVMQFPALIPQIDARLDQLCQG